MSLLQSYHNKDFGVVCSDGRVSVRLRDGRPRALQQETAKKFIVLRRSPDVILCGTSSHSKLLDFSVHAAVRRYVTVNPEASFDQVASVIAPTFHETLDALGIVNGAHRPPGGKLGEKIYRFLVGRFPEKFFDSSDRLNLNLLGYDPGRMRVRNRVFSCTCSSCDEWEHESGVTISGFLDSDEGIVYGDKLLELIGRPRTPQSVEKAMRSIADQISARYPETIGPPYCFHTVTRSTTPSCGPQIAQAAFIG
jgi:hypothetical protein